MIELMIPKLGMTMENAKLLSWQFNSGDAVKKEDIIFVIETDKITFEVPSPADGIIHPVSRAGETYPVAQTVGYLADNGEEYERLVKDYPAETPASERTEEMKEKSSATKAAAPQAGTASGKRVKASPVARSMASSHGLDLSEIQGTGPGGRIIKEDILRVLEEKAEADKDADKKEAFVLGAVDKDFPGKEAGETISISGIRRAIYENMHLSLSQTAQVTFHTEACAGALIDIRDRFNQRVGEGEIKFSYNAILVKIAATALGIHPKINSSVEGDEIKVWRQIHIGVAMESEDALIVPVIRNPDRKSINEINQDLNELIGKTKENRLLPDDLANSTFTISNLGFTDIDYFTPILRPPESALLGVGRIVKKPVIKDDQIIPGARIGLSLTCDHRIIDGAPAARFLKTIKEIIEEPVLLLTNSP